MKVHLALGYTDMRKGFDSLTVLVQEELKKDPFSGHLFAFRGRKAHTIKILFWDGNGLCLFTNYLPSYCTSFNVNRRSLMSSLFGSLRRGQ